MSAEETTQNTSASPSGQIQGPARDAGRTTFKESVCTREIDTLGHDVEDAAKSLKSLVDRQIEQFEAIVRSGAYKADNQQIQNIRTDYDNLNGLVSHLPGEEGYQSRTEQLLAFYIQYSTANVPYNFDTTNARLHDIRYAIAFTAAAIKDFAHSDDADQDATHQLDAIEQSLMNWRRKTLDPLLNRANDIKTRLETSTPAL